MCLIYKKLDPQPLFSSLKGPPINIDVHSLFDFRTFNYCHEYISQSIKTVVYVLYLKNVGAILNTKEALSFVADPL